MTKPNFKSILPKRPEDSHKGAFGHVLNVAGSEFYTGAAYFSSVSALKVGCGLVTLASEATALRAVASLCPDIILFPVEKIKKDFLENFQVVSIGCGLSKSKNAEKIFKKVLKLMRDSQIPLVIDADGLNILSKFPPPLRGRVREGGTLPLPLNTILTPHPKEMARLMGVNVNEILEKPEFWVKKCVEKYNATVVLKMHKTLVADTKGNFYENNTGNSALSHGGTGDVLCGMISGFIVQRVNTFDACCLAVYLHGLAAEIASEELTEYSVLASDLVNYITKAIKTLMQT